eukprot:SM000165S02189  [mRNA]  locus=s165:82398:83884:+ [translate_table: standard]
MILLQGQHGLLWMGDPVAIRPTSLFTQSMATRFCEKRKATAHRSIWPSCAQARRIVEKLAQCTGKKRTKHLQQPNLQYRRLWWPEGNRFVRLRLCTKALKTVERKGLAAMAAEAGLDLNKH